MTELALDKKKLIIQWYKDYASQLFSYLVLLVSSHSDAEDLLQDVFSDMIRKGIDPERIRRPKSFVYRLARNKANGLLRKRYIRKELPFNPVFHDRGATEEPRYILNNMLNWALAQLSELERETVVLKAYEGMTFREVAYVTGSLLPTVASRYLRGIAHLKRLLKEEL